MGKGTQKHNMFPSLGIVSQLNQAIPIYHIENMMGRGLFMQVQRRFSPCIPLTHIYMSCISQVCGRIFKHTIFKIVYNGNRNTTCSHLLGIVSQLNEFQTIPSQILPTYKSQSIFLGIHLTSSIRNL